MISIIIATVVGIIIVTFAQIRYNKTACLNDGFQLAVLLFGLIISIIGKKQYIHLIQTAHWGPQWILILAFSIFILVWLLLLESQKRKSNK